MNINCNWPKKELHNLSILAIGSRPNGGTNKGHVVCDVVANPQKFIIYIYVSRMQIIVCGLGLVRQNGFLDGCWSKKIHGHK